MESDSNAEQLAHIEKLLQNYQKHAREIEHQLSVFGLHAASTLKVQLEEYTVLIQKLEDNRSKLLQTKDNPDEAVVDKYLELHTQTVHLTSSIAEVLYGMTLRLDYHEKANNEALRDIWQALTKAQKALEKIDKDVVKIDRRTSKRSVE